MSGSYGPGPFKYARNFSPNSSRPGKGIQVTGEDLRAAIDAVLAGNQVTRDQRPSIGCNIKWKQ